MGRLALITGEFRRSRGVDLSARSGQVRSQMSIIIYRIGGLGAALATIITVGILMGAILFGVLLLILNKSCSSSCAIPL